MYLHKHTHTSFIFMQMNIDEQMTIPASYAVFFRCFFSVFVSLYRFIYYRNFPLIGTNFTVLLFLSLTGGLNKLTKAAQLCRDLPMQINSFSFLFSAFLSTSHLNLLSSFYPSP